MSKTEWLRLEPPSPSVNPQVFVKARGLLWSLQLKLKYKGNGTTLVGEAHATLLPGKELLLDWDVSFDSRGKKFAFAAAKEEISGKSKWWRVENEVCYLNQNDEENEVPAPAEGAGRAYLPVQALFALLGHKYSPGQQGRILLLLGAKYYQAELHFESEDRIDLRVSSLDGSKQYTGCIQLSQDRERVEWIEAKVPVLGRLRATQVLD